jgi:hypothetical protein
MPIYFGIWFIVASSARFLPDVFGSPRVTYRKNLNLFANSTGLCAAFIASIHHLQRGMALHGATVVGLCIALFALMPAMTFAQQGKISVDSIPVVSG